MKTGKLGSILPPQSLILLMLCGVGVLVFLLWVILPAQRLSAELDRDIENLQSRIEEQKILSPVFKNLFAKTKTAEPQGLPARRIQSAHDADVVPKLQGNVEKVVTGSGENGMAG
jgi:hypothetical protein